MCRQTCDNAIRPGQHQPSNCHHPSPTGLHNVARTLAAVASDSTVDAAAAVGVWALSSTPHHRLVAAPPSDHDAASYLSTLLFYFQADLLLSAVALAVLVWWGAIWLVHLTAICFGEYRLYRKSRRRLVSCAGGAADSSLYNNAAGDFVSDAAVTETPLLGVSVLKPLVGLDANLWSNLESFFQIDYPKFELLFCIHSSVDPVIMVVQSLMSKYPHVDARVFTGGEQVGVNPKINNMMPGYRAAKYELIQISDSGIKSKPGQLSDLVAHMRKDVAIVTQVPYTEDRKGFGATLEKVYFGTAHARIYLAGNATDVVCITGMSMLLRRSAIEDCGGLAPFGSYLAEDYFIGQALKARGWKSDIGSMPVMQNSSLTSAKRFEERICRWMKLRVAMLPHMIPLEPIQECMLLGVLASWASNHLLHWNALVVFLCHLLTWMLLDYVLISVMQNGPLPFSKFEFVVTWFYRECIALPLYIRALIDSRIEWRTGAFRLSWGGRVERIEEEGKLAPYDDVTLRLNGKSKTALQLT